MSVKNAKKFLDDIEKDPKLKAELKLGQSLIDLQKRRRSELSFTPTELEKALKQRWGDIYDNCILPMCFSEAPGF